MTGYVSTKTNNSEFNISSYKIGSTYTFLNETNIGKNGFHFCKEIKDLFMSKPQKGFKAYKIEVLGEVINYSGFSTNKFRVIEEIDVSDWVKFDEMGNVIYYKNDRGIKERYEYDQNGNLVHYIKEYSDVSIEFHKKYDQNGNCIHHKSNGGYESWMEYNEMGNLIGSKSNYGTNWAISIE